MTDLKHLTFRVKKDVAEQFKALCKEKGLTQGKQIELMIADFISNAVKKDNTEVSKKC